MEKREIEIKNKPGLESKLAAMFIQKASRFKSTIWIEKEERKANAKSLLGVLSLGIACGTKIFIKVEGEDEKEAIEELVTFLQTDFEEKE